MPNPPKLFDTHAHFFTDDVDHYPVDVTNSRQPADVLIARLKANPATAEHVLALWEESGVVGGAAVQYNTIYKTDNRYTIDVADRHHDRTSAVLILNAAAPGTPEQLETLAARHNVSGLRLFGYPDDAGNHPWLDSPAALKTWDVAAQHRLAMVLMYAPGQPTHAALSRIVALAKRYPDTPITLDHCGWTRVDGGLAGTIGEEHRTLIDSANIHFKVTQINFNRFAEAGIDPAQFVRLIVDTFGADRVMWGSDYGNTDATYPQMVAQAIAATALLDDGEREKLLLTNGRKLFDDRVKAIV